ncbi:hypothetical protein CVT24_008749 [Panaeolus cyanescens]|uniref:Uncharacterized protein n=1 Tax=Panaeolus cyanescens TaxID=181874 RepID=A0A409YX61_9AGAR|nr:hypothetical protein CVT24_008749 [Panaeolus cyanescens]
MAMTSPKDALEFSGFRGCASSREYDWHLGADRQEQWNRFPSAQSWRWKPSDECEEHLDPLAPGALIKHLVEDGGWFLVGDSVTESHFFSLSCILYPHVIATPNYTGQANFDRSWPQHLYLNASSPLVPHLSFPSDFSITSTPLVSFKRVDILFSQQELRDMHKKFHPHIEDPSLFSDEKVWTVSLEEYLAEFLEPRPEANYKTMIVSTGGHWTTSLFSKTLPSGPGIEGVMLLFEGAVKRWAERVQGAITEYNKQRTWRWGSKESKKEVLIRAYLPGHEDCHKFDKPWDEIQPFVWNWFNWGEIWRYNWSFEKLLAERKKFPNIHYLGIDRPARLRPDAHASSDCLHIMAGAGVLEGWTHYIWHFITHL